MLRYSWCKGLPCCIPCYNNVRQVRAYVLMASLHCPGLSLPNIGVLSLFLLQQSSSSMQSTLIAPCSGEAGLNRLYWISPDVQHRSDDHIGGSMVPICTPYWLTPRLIKSDSKHVYIKCCSSLYVTPSHMSISSDAPPYMLTPPTCLYQVTPLLIC